MPKKLTIIGMITWDTLLELDRFVVEDGKHFCKLYGPSCGGCATNVALNLAVLNSKPELITWTGDDSIAVSLRRFLISNGLSTNLVSSVPGSTRQAFILLNRETTTRTAILADRQDPPSLNDQQIRRLRESQLLYYDGSWVEVISQLLDAKRSCGIPLFINCELPDYYQHNIVSHADFIVVSAKSLLGDSWDEGAAKNTLQQMWSSQSFITITAGVLGSLTYDGRRFYKVPSIGIDVVDSTGAGDAFQAGLLWGILKNWTLEESLRCATAVASFQCTHYGPNLAGMERPSLLKTVDVMKTQVRLCVESAR